MNNYTTTYNFKLTIFTLKKNITVFYIEIKAVTYDEDTII